MQETDPILQKLSDTEIVLNFRNSLEKIYPYLININAQCYDPYDEIVENLFQSMVYRTFADKYGTSAHKDQCWIYEISPSRRSPGSVNHIEIIPKAFPFNYRSNETDLSMTVESIKDTVLLFLNFGDGLKSLTGSLTQEEAQSVNFNFVRFAIFNRNKMYFEESINLWTKYDSIDFKYSAKEE